MIISKKRITKALIRLRGCAGWSAPVFFATPRRQFFSRRGPYDAYHPARNATIKTLMRINERRLLSLSSSANWQQFAVENVIFLDMQVHESLVLITNAYAQLCLSFLVSCNCFCPVAHPHGAVGWSAMCDCGIS